MIHPFRIRCADQPRGGLIDFLPPLESVVCYAVERALAGYAERQCEAPGELVAHTQASFGGTQSRADAATFVVFAVQVEFDRGLQDQPAGEQRFLFDHQARYGLTGLAGTNPGLPSEDTYSNFGYSLLGRVIEARTGKTYENYVRDTILKPAGATGMVIGGDKEADRKPNEVKYYGSGAYSSVKPQRFDSHGGWIATPTDLLRFMRHETVLSNSYAHYGSMSGTNSVYRRRSDGLGYAVTANSSKGDVEEIDAMLKEIVEGVSSWPSINLF